MEVLKIYLFWPALWKILLARRDYYLLRTVFRTFSNFVDRKDVLIDQKFIPLLLEEK